MLQKDGVGGVVRLSILPKAAYFEGRGREVVHFRVPTQED